MKNLVVFDLDGTLAEIGCAVQNDDVEKLKEIERYAFVAICSGKPIYYLCGFSRQLGLKKPIHIGENGATVCFGYDLPPAYYEKAKLSEEAENTLNELKREIGCRLGDEVWFQPNEIALTPFPATADAFDSLDRLVEDYKDRLRDLNVYRQCDCYDFCPKGIDKAAGVTAVMKKLGIDNEHLYVVGDGNNDVSMLALTAHSYGIGQKVKAAAEINCQKVSQALDDILARLKNN
ncbi:MAG: HAD family hydrolase [Christensenellales bacterium]